MFLYKVSNITTEARTTLTEWLAADYQLYDHFKVVANSWGRIPLLSSNCSFNFFLSTDHLYNQFKAKFNAAVESYGKVGGAK